MFQYSAIADSSIFIQLLEDYIQAYQDYKAQVPRLSKKFLPIEYSEESKSPNNKKNENERRSGK